MGNVRVSWTDSARRQTTTSHFEEVRMALHKKIGATGAKTRLVDARAPRERRKQQILGTAASQPDFN